MKITNLNRLIRIGILLLLFGFISIGVPFLSANCSLTTENIPLMSSFNQSAMISIDGNNNLTATAIDYGWTGDGSIESPFIISGIDLSVSEGLGLSILNSNLYFEIHNATIIGEGVNNTIGFYFKNVTNGVIYNSTSNNHTDSDGDDYYTYLTGFLFENCSNMKVKNCNASNSDQGIFIGDKCTNITVDDCMLENNDVGVKIYATSTTDRTQNTTIVNSTFSGNINGLFIGFSTITTKVENNCVFNNSNGIVIGLGTYDNYIRNNNIHRNEISGINIADCYLSFFINNTIVENGKYGILLNSEPSKNLFAFNLLANNSEYGVIDRFSEEELESVREYRNVETNVFLFNNFVSNNQGGIQTLINNSNFLFENNFWSDHLNPDKNQNGIVDDPYLLDGSIQMEDKKPVTSMNVYQGEVIEYPSFTNWLNLLWALPITAGFIAICSAILKKNRK